MDINNIYIPDELYREKLKEKKPYIYDNLSAERKEIEEKMKLTWEWISLNCSNSLDKIVFGMKG